MILRSYCSTYNTHSSIVVRLEYNTTLSRMAKIHHLLSSSSEQASSLYNVSSFKQPFINSSLVKTPSEFVSIFSNISRVRSSGASPIFDTSVSVIKYIACNGYTQSGDVMNRLFLGLLSSTRSLVLQKKVLQPILLIVSAASRKQQLRIGYVTMLTPKSINKMLLVHGFKTTPVQVSPLRDNFSFVENLINFPRKHKTCCDSPL